jgi:hypothetical protein
MEPAVLIFELFKYPEPAGITKKIKSNERPAPVSEGVLGSEHF